MDIMTTNSTFTQATSLTNAGVDATPPYHQWLERAEAAVPPVAKDKRLKVVAVFWGASASFVRQCYGNMLFINPNIVPASSGFPSWCGRCYVYQWFGGQHERKHLVLWQLGRIWR